MTEHELYCKKLFGAIGAAMLIFLGLINLFGLVYSFLSILLALLPISSVAATVIDQLFYAAGYMACFMVPVAFLRLFLKKGNCRPRPMNLAPRISPELPLYIFAGVAICFSAAQLNAALVSIFDYSSFSSEILWGNVAQMEPYEIVLQFIVISVVPGICEEFFFRGAILENCLPLGRSNAIFISAFLFAMMHQNIEQLLYTFVAGIVLGLVYTHTGSIWNCTLLHLFNNFVSVLQTVILQKYGESEMASLLILLFDGVIYLLGAISIVILIVKFASDRRDPSDGVFEVDLPAAPEYAEHPVSPRRMRRLFLRPTMLIFLILGSLQMITLIAMAVML